jgi:hypothetical protein
MVSAGFRAPATVVLVSRGALAGPLEVMPDGGHAMIALATPLDYRSAIAAGVAMLHRWHLVAARFTSAGRWDRWEVARRAPLSEWIYAAGLGVHAAREFAEASPAAALQLTTGGLSRLRAAERALQERLDTELDQRGVGLLMRWLDDEAPAAMRRASDGVVVPAGAGRYLGWRMLEERVARVGILEASLMSVS